MLHADPNIDILYTDISHSPLKYDGISEEELKLLDDDVDNNINVASARDSSVGKTEKGHDTAQPHREKQGQTYAVKLIMHRDSMIVRCI